MGAAGIGLVAGLGLAAAVLTGDDGPPPAVVPVPGTVVAIATPPAVLGPAGALDVDGWLNTEARSLDAARGRVTVVHFWALDCGDCTDMTPALGALLSEYGAAGLQVVSVHSPRFDHERDDGAVILAADALAMTWPIALDHRGRSLDTWQGERAFLPRTYVVDANGQIRYNRVGNGDIDVLESTVAWLLANGGA
ncbi:MAG: redoxin domain-containing protein [Acidimicrobiales bacterium]